MHPYYRNQSHGSESGTKHPNSSELFLIHTKSGKRKEHIKSGFLSSRWISLEDANRGTLSLDDGETYNLSMTNALFFALQSTNPSQRVRAICSFQEHTDGQKIVIAKLLDRKPVVQDVEEELKTLTGDY